MDLIRPAFSISHDCAVWTIHATSEIKGKFWLKAIRVILAIKYGINTKINPSYFFMFRRLQKRFTCSFYKQHFYK